MPTEMSEPILQVGWFPLLLNYWPVFVVAFVASLVCTPIMRIVATKFGVVDHPDEERKTGDTILGWCSNLHRSSRRRCCELFLRRKPVLSTLPLSSIAWNDRNRYHWVSR